MELEDIAAPGVVERRRCLTPEAGHADVMAALDEMGLCDTTDNCFQCDPRPAFCLRPACCLWDDNALL